MGTGSSGGRIISGALIFLCVITDILRSLASTTRGGATESIHEVRENNEKMRFQDWSQVVATKQGLKWRKSLSEGDSQPKKVTAVELSKEREHQIARERIQTWLTPSAKWHYVIGYSNVKALQVARRITHGARVHHFPGGSNSSSLHYFLSFISVETAEALRKQSVFYVVEPLLPYLKIEDLTLGELIRDHENAMINAHDERVALKATLAAGALTVQDVKLLARRWQLELQKSFLFSPATLRYMDTEGQMGIHDDQEVNFLVKSSHSMKVTEVGKSVECQGEVTAIVCSLIVMSALQRAANFMALHAVVQLVELNPRYEVFNKWAKYVTQSVSGKHLPLFKKGLLGEGEVIACADTGIDMDHCFFRDKYQPVPFNAVNLQARKVVQYVISEGDKTDVEEGHGTHVAGSIAGDTEEGSHEFAGMAPMAKIDAKMKHAWLAGTAFYDLGSNSSNLKAPAELGKGVFEHGYRAGARIFSNSWGVLRQGYGSNSHEVDSFSYLNENVLIIFAVGNHGALGKGTVASPASSKNCLAVGASFNAAASLASQQEDYPRILMKPSTVAPFSSAGPTLDGRIKPDVLAPGMIIWSSVPDVGHGPPEQNCQIGAKQGTSSSTPVVAGLASLARQYFREGYYPSGKKSTNDSFIPIGALLKAVMIHSAVPEERYVNSTGTNDLQLAPDYVQGFGLVVLEKVLVFTKPRSKHQPSRLLVLSGRKDGAVMKHMSFQTLTLTVTSSKEPLRMTMVWMDPPAAPSSLHPMVNDLNLKAQSPNGKIVHPNGLEEEDPINNVEVIHVVKPKKGRWRVRVEAARVLNDRQPYALVVTGSFKLKGRSVNKAVTDLRGNIFPLFDNVTSDGSAHWRYSCGFSIFLGAWSLVVPLLEHQAV